jgi:hypothetical protein
VRIIIFICRPVAKVFSLFRCRHFIDRFCQFWTYLIEINNQGFILNFEGFFYFASLLLSHFSKKHSSFSSDKNGILRGWEISGQKSQYLRTKKISKINNHYVPDIFNRMCWKVKTYLIEINNQGFILNFEGFFLLCFSIVKSFFKKT